MNNISDSLLKNYFNDIKFVFKEINGIREHLDVIFVFGKEENPMETKSFLSPLKDKLCQFSSSKSLRKEFLKDIQKKNSVFTFLTIEKLYTDLRQYTYNKKGIKTESIQIAQLELLAIKNAYSIIIFPESPGSFTELGYFAAKDETREKILIFNQIKFYSDRSYVNSVVDLVYEKKDTKPILVDKTLNDNNLNDCIKCLMSEYNDYNEDVYTSVNIKKHYMYPIALIYELIKIFPYLEFSELTSLVLYVFQVEKIVLNVNKKLYISSMISLLVLSNLIKRDTCNNKIVLLVVNSNFSLLKFNTFEESKEKKLLEIELKIRITKGI